MLCSQKSFFFIILFFPFCANSSEQSFQLSRVNFPDATLISVESKQANIRALKKYMITTSALMASVVGLYLLYQVREAARAHDQQNSKVFFENWMQKEGLLLVQKDKIAPALLPILSPDKKMQFNESGSWASSLKSFGFDTAKFFTDGAFLLASGAVLNGFYNYTCDKINQAYVDETVLWYAHEKTKIPLIFNDLKNYATDYDLFASLLSAELFNQDASMHLTAFVKELLGSAQNYINNDVFRDSAYFEYLLANMKKKYIKKGQELEKLSDYVIPAVAKRNRIIVQNHAAMLFANDMQRRADIAKMCDVLVQEMQKMTAFMSLRGGLHQKSRIYDLVEAFNKFLTHMEMLLNSTPEQLQALSKSDCGMFTSVYEYEKLFTEQINFLHRYCRLTN